MLALIVGFLLSAYSSADVIRVGVIDTGLDTSDLRFHSHMCLDGHKDFSHFGIWDYDGHGTHVAGLIQQYAKDANYCLVIIKSYDTRSTGEENANHFRDALTYATTLDLALINISLNGPGTDKEEEDAIKEHPHTLFVVAAGNEGENLDIEVNKTYPACYVSPNIIVVGNRNSDGIDPSSNHGKTVTAWEDGSNVLSTLPGGYMGRKSGTSMSTAIHTGKMAYEFPH